MSRVKNPNISLRALKRYDRMKKKRIVCTKCRIASIDIAIKNFAISIEDRSYGRVDVIYINRVCLSESGDIVESFHNLIDFLDEIEIERCDIVVVEEQLKRNTMAMRMFQHVISTLMKYESIILYGISAKMKGKAFGCPNLKGRDLKKWGIETAYKLLEDRGTPEVINTIKGVKGKKDDMCDCLIQCEAFWRNNPIEVIIMM